MVMDLRGFLCVSLIVTLIECIPITNPSKEYLPPASENETTSKTEKPPVVDNGDRTREEHDNSKPALKYWQNLFVDVLQPKPIVDNIREEDKYGNNGGKLDVVGRGIVTGVEKVTTLISSAVDIPYDVLKSITRKATETLNSIGAKIVGI
ncbi:hypothetical protein C0J52_18247 [Blattella germanica]|nr:hypothetical protein C0J52_18247 [Blattella germanica]